MEAIGKELADLEDKAAEVQQLYAECLVKLLRGNPVRARLTLTDSLFDCHATLSAEEARAKALEVRASHGVRAWRALCPRLQLV